ncbi:hypothetical protein QFC19_008997 [Naganishia cerealis]|uniref:Uncharacterized protein n=1 Tax=Naganishia cerealis TaxID=610337 RepID=A0ACC2UZ03_9TREE|nr:hypothetical protein QFC19_008997 [Naganishia cerealis]
MPRLERYTTDSTVADVAKENDALDLPLSYATGAGEILKMIRERKAIVNRKSQLRGEGDVHKMRAKDNRVVDSDGEGEGEQVADKEDSTTKVDQRSKASKRVDGLGSTSVRAFVDDNMPSGVSPKAEDYYEECMKLFIGEKTSLTVAQEKAVMEKWKLQVAISNNQLLEKAIEQTERELAWMEGEQERKKGIMAAIEKDFDRHVQLQKWLGISD